MFLERHLVLHDPNHKHYDLRILNDKPGWKSFSDWEVDPETGHLICFAGWMAMYDTYYFAALGSLGSTLLFKAQGRIYKDGILVEDELREIPIWDGPQPVPPTLQCILL